jgi:hypothetical protein
MTIMMTSMMMTIDRAHHHPHRLIYNEIFVDPLFVNVEFFFIGSEMKVCSTQIIIYGQGRPANLVVNYNVLQPAPNNLVRLC